MWQAEKVFRLIPKSAIVWHHFGKSKGFFLFQSLVPASLFTIYNLKMSTGPSKVTKYCAWGQVGLRHWASWGGKSRVSLGIDAHRWHAHPMTYQWCVRDACFSFHCSFGNLLREANDRTSRHLCLPFLFLWEDREPKADQALQPWSICYNRVQKTEGEKKIRHEAKVPSWRRMGNLENINWVAALHLGVGLLFRASVQEWMSHPSSVGELLCWTRVSNSMCFHSAPRWNWLHWTIDPAAPAQAVKLAFSRGFGRSGIRSCGWGPSGVVEWWGWGLWGEHGSGRELTGPPVLSRHEVSFRKEQLSPLRHRLPLP